MNANTSKVGAAFLVLNTLWFSRATVNVQYLQSDMISHLVPNGLFYVLPIPTTAFIFTIVAALYFISGLFYLGTFHKYALLIFFLAGSIVDNIQVNFADGGHSRYLQYSLLLHATMALFLQADSKVYLKSLRSLVIAYYFIAGLYKLSVAGLGWGLDDSIFVHAVAVQASTPLKEYILTHMPEFFRIGAYLVFLAEILSPLIFFYRPARWLIVGVLFVFHIGFPIVWGGHGDFVVNCVGLALCLSDEVWLNKISLAYESSRISFIKMITRKRDLNV